MSTDPVPVSPPPTGHTADILSRLGLRGGLFALALVAAVDIAVTVDEPGTQLFPPPVSTVIYTGLFVLVLASVTVQLYLRLRCGQRRIENGLRRLEELIDTRYAEGFADGAAGRSAAPVLRLVRDSTPGR